MNANGGIGGFDARERVLVIGLGRSGLASCAVLRARGATVYATDEKDPQDLSEARAAIERAGVRFVTPSELERVTPELTSAVLSPGIPLNGALVRRIQAARVPVFSEIEVAYRICKAPIVAVTGTKGKTTTTALIGELFRHAGRVTHVGGNIGNALITETAIAEPNAWVIAEVSSFQLESIRSFKPRISTILNVSPDHLDRYHSMDEYAEAKFRIFANQNAGDAFVGNLDDPVVGALADPEGGNRIPCRAYWFGHVPRRLTTLYVRNERITYAPPSGDPRPVEVMPLDEIPLLGAHNVAEIDGVRYVDDSKSTNPGSVIAALETFAEPTILIVGGRSKGTDFSAMGAVAKKRAKAVIVIGEAAGEIAGVLDGAHTARAASMEEAVAIARALATPGDVVLLSPGCASFDMFGSAEARGDAFARAVSPETVAHG